MSQAGAPARERVLQRLELLIALVGRNLKLRHDGRSLGAAWALGPLLVQFGVLVFVFERVIDAGLDDYAAFLLSGLLVWAWFAGGIGDAPWSVVRGRDLVHRPGFPAVLLPAVSVGAPLVTFALALPILLGVVWIDTGRVPSTALLLPLVMAVQAVVMLGAALVVAMLTVRHREVPNVVSAALTVAFYGSPVLYSASDVPDHVRPFYDLNPLVHLLDGYRDVLVAGRLPGSPLLLVLAAGLAGLGLANQILSRREGRFVDDL